MTTPPLDAKQRAVHRALSQLDDELAGLFLRGCELIDRIEEPGVRYLLAHIGRELSKAVLQIAAREVPPVAGKENPSAAGAEPETETLRQPLAQCLQLELDDERLDAMLEMLGDEHAEIVARALSLSRKHPFVRSWVKLQRALVGATHYRKGRTPPSAARVAEAFQQLVDVLFGRVAPYFTAQDELDPLLQIPVPQAADIERIRALLVRPQLRFRFYRELQHPAWLPPLREAGSFDHPPEWFPIPGGHRLSAWPEGELLVRLADQEPELVTEVLANVPRDLQNPAVWQLVANAIARLPAPLGRKLVPRLVDAARSPQASYYALALIDATRALAAAGDRKAFKLGETLLRLRPLQEDAGSPEKKWFRFKPEKLLLCLDRYGVSEVIAKVVPALEAVDALMTWSLLIDKLKLARCFADRAGFDDDRFSIHWCPSLTTASEDDDFRAQLAVAALAAGRSAVQRDPALLDTLLAQLDSDGTELFARMRVALIAGVGEHAQARLDEILRDPVTLDPPHDVREIARLLRNNFGLASADARQAFVTALTTGPAEAELRTIAEVHGDDPDNPEARQEALTTWQQTRLRWFYDQLPEELHPLADRLGVVPTAPTPREQALDKGESFATIATPRQSISPVSAEELRQWSADQIVTFLKSWQPTDGRFNVPSEQGLEDALVTSFEVDVSAHGDLIQALAQDNAVPARYRQAILIALRQAVEQDKAVPWREALDFVTAVLRVTETPDTSRKAAWCAIRKEALLFVEVACSTNRLAAAFQTLALECVELALDTMPYWTDDPPRACTRFDDIISIGLGTEAGRIADLAIIVMDWALRTCASEEQPTVRARSERWLERIRTWPSPDRVAGRARLGQHLPYILHWQSDWWSRHEEDCFGTGMTQPIDNPTWGAYLTFAPFRTDSFASTRPWFGRHAAALPDLLASENAISQGDKDWRLSRHYTWHAVLGYLYGCLNLGEADRAFETIFETERAEDRADAYRAVHLEWKGMATAPATEQMERLLQLWEWRLDRLETGTPGDAQEEANALCWFIRIHHLPTDRVLPLARRTLALAAPSRPTRRMLWPRVTELGQLDAAAGIAMATRLIETELASEWPYFNITEIESMLRSGLTSDDSSVRDRAVDLVHRIGDNGWSEFRSLLPDVGRDMA